MAAVTIEAKQGWKDIISPTRGRYFIKMTWIVDKKTLKPVRMAPLEYATSVS